MRYEEGNNLKGTLNESLLQLAKNLEAIQYLREDKVSAAINLLNADNEAKLVYLMYYDDIELHDPEFTRRKKKVLTTLGAEWVKYPRPKNDAFKSDPEWQKYQRNFEHYLNSYTTNKRHDDEP